MLLASKHFSGTVVCISYFFFFFFLVCAVNPSKILPSLFSPSVLACSLRIPKQKWMNVCLGWGIWGHILMTSHSTLPCIIGCRIWPECYMTRPSRHRRNVCVYLLSCLYKICSWQASAIPVRWILVLMFSFCRITCAAGRSRERQETGHVCCLGASLWQGGWAEIYWGWP